MRKILISLTMAIIFSAVFFTVLQAGSKRGALIIDHRHTKISSLNNAAVNRAVNKLRIVYGHTSHGSQLMSGLRGLQSFNKKFFTLPQITDGTIGHARDLGQPNRTEWINATRDYLKNHTDTNIAMWSWCGQVSWSSEKHINAYLTAMSKLEREFPGVIFVYMTGHLDGSGERGNLNQRNNQIRKYCRKYGKVLYDFADIESYDPSGREYMSKGANDNCDYDSDGNGSRDRNWAEDWQRANPGKWFNCSCAHSKALNGNMKAYAAWNLFAALGKMVR